MAVTYFVAGCEMPVEEIVADDIAQAAEIYAENNSWPDEPSYYDGNAIFVVAKSKVTEKTFFEKAAYAIE